MSIFDIFRVGHFKAQLEDAERECAALRLIVAETDRMDYRQLKATVADLREQANAMVTQLETFRGKISHERAKLDAEVDAKRQEIIILDDQLLLQSFGIYTPRYGLEDSDAYAARLESIRVRQVDMVKRDVAASCPTNWTLNNSKTEGRRMIRDYTKLIVRSFNNECDASIVRVKFNNLAAIEKKIARAFETLNKLAGRMSIAICKPYLDLKIEELHLVYEYQVKKQEEREEQKRLREQMREEARLMKEIEEAKEIVQKEERHFANALLKLDKQLTKATTDTERALFEEERATILKKMDELGHVKEDILYREQNTRAGYVYVISNIGSFGEGIFKIGVTRRLDPRERVEELSDASVPFNFDIHALIFSDDAPTLENALHKAFSDRRLNRINLRREYFRVELGEIEAVIRENFKKPVEFTRLAEAEQFRQSQQLALQAVKAA